MKNENDTTQNKKAYQTAAFGVPEYEMKRVGDYKPRIFPEHLLRLKALKQQTQKPITKLIAEALDLYFKR